MAAAAAISRTAGTSCTGAAVLTTITSRTAQHKHSRSRLLREASAASSAVVEPTKVEQTKQELLTWISGTKRGSSASKQLRGQIEEAQVALEACCPAELNYSLLEGKWVLQYTTAADVVPIVALNVQLPFGAPAPLEVGNIYQRFSDVAEGHVENIIEFSIPFLLQQQRGATFTVGARYEVRSGRRIALTFEQADVSHVRISPALEALLAPAILPRGYLQQQLLLAIKEFRVTFPFRSAQQVTQGAAVGADYLLTYLDEDVLIGRASGTAGTFIFTRDKKRSGAC